MVGLFAVVSYSVSRRVRNWYSPRARRDARSGSALVLRDAMTLAITRLRYRSGPRGS